MGALGRKLAGTLIIGLALFIAWMQLRGPSDDRDVLEMSSIPLTAFEGGGGLVDVRFTTNQPAELIATFEKLEEGTDGPPTLRAREAFAAGSFDRSVDVSPTAHIDLQLNIPDAAVGARLSWVIDVDGQPVVRESMQLEDPFEAGYAFSLQIEADDIAEMRTWR